MIHQIGRLINNFYWSKKLSNTHDIFDDDWANLIILDGCRFDTYEKLTSIEGNLKKRISTASWTPGFLKSNFEGRDLTNTVYITANPLYAAERWFEGDISSSFYQIEDIWRECWDEQAGTVHPEAMMNKSIELPEEYPHKRLIFHFIQPHIPFIGDTDFSINQVGMRSRDVAMDDKSEKNGFQIWEAARENKVSLDKLTSAYEENLSLVLPYINKMINKFQHTTVITSDHGNHLGMRQYPIPVRHYGHPPDVITPALREVPWHIISKQPKDVYRNRSNVVEDNQSDIKHKLEDLGYA
jgi:hypothetical protein